MKLNEHEVELNGLRLALKAFVDLHWIPDGAARLNVEPKGKALAALETAKALLEGKSLTPAKVEDRVIRGRFG